MEITSVSSDVKSFNFAQSFEDILTKLNDRLQTLLTSDAILFRVNLPRRDVWHLYQELLLEEGGVAGANHFNCSTCRTTVERFGNVVSVDEDGNLIPVMWGDYTEDLDNPLARVHAAIYRKIAGQKIVSQWFSKESVIGTPVTQTEDGTIWTHMAADIPPHLFKMGEADSLIGKSKERFRTMMNAETGIHQFSLDVFQSAVNLFASRMLNGTERFISSVEFHRGVRESILTSNTKRNLTNQLWKQLARVPNGWENVNSTMLGQLYGWIKSGDPIESIKRKWNTRTSGEVYQRATVAPSEQTIKQAEELVATLGIEKALHRRFARLDEINCFWKPRLVTGETPATGGVFSKIKSKDSSPVAMTQAYEAPVKPVTWEKFAEKILPEATAIKFNVPFHGSFCALVTQTHEDAPPIMKWDSEDNRYPVSMYLYVEGSPARRWNLANNTWVNVTGITSHPGVDEGYMFILEGCADTNTQQGLALFPADLRNELFGVRSVIEAYSNSEQLTGQEDASACGYQVGGSNFGIQIEVTTAEGKQKYLIDRRD